MLCREYGLSVIKNPGKSPPRMIYLAEKNGEPTRYNVFRQAIDRAIAGALIKSQFEAILRAQGFEVELHGKCWTIKMIGDNRATRLYRLGENYTGKSVMDRIAEGGLSKRAVRYEVPKPVVKIYRFKGTFQKPRTLTGYRALYSHFLYRMGVLPKNKPRPPRHPILWEDVRQVRKYTEQIRLLCRNKIDDSGQLRSFIETTQNCMDDFIRQRTCIQNNLRREKVPEVIEELKAEKTAITAHIAPLRRELRVASEIETQTAKMKEKLAVIQALEARERQAKQSKSLYRGGQVYTR